MRLEILRKQNTSRSSESRTKSFARICSRKKTEPSFCKLAGENARDRAFIDCHLEAGTRPGEILNLQISHVKFDKFGAVLHVDGKTGARTVRLIRSTPSLATWLSIHPLKDKPDSPLWISTRKNHFGEYLSYSSARLMVRRRCKQANLPKRLHLNLFRHSEATETAKFMTEAQMKKRHGWTADSKMPARYVHLAKSRLKDVNWDIVQAIVKDDYKATLIKSDMQTLAKS